jgi:hypothetical protein
MSAAAWRVPAVWLVFGLPAACVLALTGLIVTAAGDGATDSVRDDVRRTAELSLADTRPDEAALRLGLRALLERRDTDLLLHLTGGALPAGTALRLVAAHPSVARRDVEVALEHEGTQWRAPVALAADQDWLLTLAPPDGAWRIRGRLHRGARELELRSALEPR